MARLEHVNISVSDPVKTAERLCKLFDWKIRWQGASLGDGYSVHVGTEDDYVALYRNGTGMKPGAESSYSTLGGLNHVGIVVDDLKLAESRIIGAGYRTTNHGDYEPGKRFYFDDEDGIEWEVVSYA